GEAEVLVAAKDLVNDRNVRPVEGGEVEYVHLLFDCHQVIYSEGLATESFLPGPQITRELDRAVLEEIQQIFPELDPVSGTGFPHAARRMLKHHEARLILSGEREVAA
ncbi:MAG TPA: 2,3,4,5-tetrahydropyridine-2,6-carboxylate N-succinyltransferase, partial [Rhodobacterales bacterium]|nr:2,3,4,5-tetrahydropyridine-2,6-carboxylate N-succinyltransferase [Rhodobacterales bacterium]